MSLDVAIEPACPADQDSVVALLSAQMLEHGFQADPGVLARIFATVVKDSRLGFFLVARLAGETVAFAYVPIIFSIEHGGRAGWLEEIYVVPARREQGIGRRLLERTMELAWELGLAALDLEVAAGHERAEGLYARNGFRRLPRTRWVKEYPC